MENISAFLQRFKRLLSTQGALATIVEETIESEFGEKIDRENIRIQNGIAHINTSPALKTAIFLKKKHLLAELESRGATRIKDIR